MNEVIIENKKVKLGDVFVNSWGYDQTNIDFSKIVGFSASGKSAKIVSIGQIIVDHDDFMSEHVMPDVNNIKGKPHMVRLGSWHEHIEAGSGNWLWDGKKELQSHYA